MRWILFTPVVLFAALAVSLWLGLGRDPSALPSALIDTEFPAMNLERVSGDGPPLTRASLEGDVALVNVFASWCGPCRTEHPTLMALAAQHEVPLFGVNWKETPEEGRAYLAQNGDPYDAVGSDANGRFALDLGVTGAPETFIVDRSGRIRYKQVGPITSEVWRDTIAPIVAQLRSEP